jgi:gentisate 1,2-dioxygenase
MTAFRQELARHNLAPLWDVLRDLAPSEPQPHALPAMWRGGLLRDEVLKAGRLISAQEAERRVLVLENPGLKGQSKITTSLYAGVQLVLPGEIARSHRHTAAAIRFILEGDGAYTSVEGEKVPMTRGDFIVTPSWSFHDHGNEGTGPAIWLDGLDVFLVNLLSTGFAEPGPMGGVTPARRADAPTFAYPYAEARAALERLRGAALDPALGYSHTYRQPSGAPPTKTMGAYLQLLPAGFSGIRHRATDGAVFAVVEGHGEAAIGGERFSLAPGDIFVTPSWQWRAFTTREDLVLFSFSDRPLQEALGFWREEREG